MSAGQPSEEELRAAYEEQIKQLRIEHVLLDNAVMMVNLGMRRTGLMHGTESERDVGEVQLAIEAVRALMPLLESAAPEQAKQIRQALSQLQLAYVQIGGTGSPAASAAASAAGPAASGDAPGSGAGAATGPADPGAGSGTADPEPASPKPPASKPGEPGPAQRSGRLWIPGQ